MGPADAFDGRGDSVIMSPLYFLPFDLIHGSG